MQMNTDQVTNFEVKIRLLKSSYADLLGKSRTAFLPGMSANVEIQTLVKKDIPCLPIEAVGTRLREKDSTNSSTSKDEELDEVVFSITDGKAVKIIVKTGIQDSRYIEIVSGVKVDKELIVGPYDAVSKKLDNDQKVKVIEKKEMERLEDKE
jgi:HlyD family secretion protein